MLVAFLAPLPGALAGASPSPADASRAQAFARQAVALEQKGDATGARDALVRAFALAPTPTLALALANARTRLGELVEARDELSAVVYDAPVPNEPAGVVGARAEAKVLFASLGPRIPRVRVALVTAPGAPVRLSLDGAALPPGAERFPLPVDPGHHTLVAESHGNAPWTVEFDIAEGAERTIAVRFGGLGSTVVSAPVAASVIYVSPGLQPSSPETPPPPPPVVARESPAEVWAPVRVGFQLDTRVSVQAPAGSFANGTSLSSILGARAYWAFDLGWKVNEWLFLGGYLGGSMGGEGGSVSQACQAATQALQDQTDENSSSACLTLGIDVGAIAIASLNPAGAVDPWVGLGLGYEHQTYAYVGVRGEFDGLEVPLLLGGVEFRARNANRESRFGIGPYLGATVQKYSNGSVASFEGSSSVSPGTHTWIHIGVRMTVFP